MNNSSFHVYNKCFSVLLLLIIHLYFLLPLLHPGITQTHDGLLHVARFAAYYKAFADGQIPPRWASDLNFHYGTPLLIFYYPLPGYLGSLLHGVFRIDFQNSYKIIMALSFLAAPITFYLWLREKFSRAAAFTSSLLYGLAPYHFLDLNVRGAVSDLLAFAFIPLIFLTIDRLEKKQTIQSVMFGAFSYMFLILSHNGLGLTFSVVISFYCLMAASRNFRLIKYYSLMLVLGLSLSAFFWLPALVEQQYTHSTLFLGNKFRAHFSTIFQLFYSPWGFGVDVAKSGGLSPQIGPIQLITALVGLVMSLKNFANRKIIVFWTIVLFIAIFLSTHASVIFWEKSTILQKLEFPWRFTALSSFACAAISPYVLKSLRSVSLTIFIILLIVMVSLPYNHVLSYQNFSDSFYSSYPASTDFGAATTRWVASEPIQFPPAPIELISGNATFTSVQKKATIHTVKIIAKGPITILDNTIYFPGWKAAVDGQMVPIEFQDASHRGLITIHVPSGTHTVRVYFQESFIRRLGNGLSAFSMLISVVILIVIYGRRNKNLSYET